LRFRLGHSGFSRGPLADPPRGKTAQSVTRPYQWASRRAWLRRRFGKRHLHAHRDRHGTRHARVEAASFPNQR